VDVAPSKTSAVADAKKPEGTTLEQRLAHAKAKATKAGAEYDGEWTTRWFHAKNSNGGGVIDDKEVAPG